MFKEELAPVFTQFLPEDGREVHTFKFILWNLYYPVNKSRWRQYDKRKTNIALEYRYKNLNKNIIRLEQPIIE